MTSDTRTALHDKVVKALDETFLQASRRGMWNVSRESDCADAAIAAIRPVVLAEAAKWLEAAPPHLSMQEYAAAIRALAKPALP